MAEYIKQIRAFIASPGGLDDERRAARAAAEEVNELLGSQIGYRIEMYGWEDTISGVGRAQAIINAEMDLCEIFIGAMWRTWGTKPDISGDYTSGFEEEFSISLAKNQDKGWPDMHLFFKTIDPAQVRDAGPELQKVLAFRKKIEDEKTLLYQTFQEAHDFGQIVKKILSAFVLKKYSNETAESKPERVTDASKAANDGNDGKQSASGAALLFEKIASASREGDVADLTSTEVARLRLVGAMSSAVGNDAVRVGTHDANLIRLAAAELNLTDDEKYKLLTSGIHALPSEVVPIWSWLADLQRDNPNVLLEISAYEEEKERHGVFTVMSWTSTYYNSGGEYGPDLVSTHWLSDLTPVSVRKESIRFMGELGTSQDIPPLERVEISQDPDTALAATNAIIYILLRESETSAVEKLVESNVEKIDAEALRLVLACFDKVDSTTLLLALDHRLPAVRKAALAQLAARGDLTIEMLDRAMEDPSHDVRLAALLIRFPEDGASQVAEAARILKKSSPYSGLFGLGHVANNEHLTDYKLAQLSKMSLDDLRALSSSREPIAEDALMELADRAFSAHAEAIRSYVDDGFEKYVKDKWPDGVQDRRNGGLLNALLIGNPEQSKKFDLMSKATDLLARKNNPTDAHRIRKSLEDGRVRLTSNMIRYFARHGHAKDANVLLNAASKTRIGLGGRNHDLRELVETALALTSDPSNVIRDETLSPEVIAALVHRMSPASFAKLGQPDWLSLLANGDHVIRRTSALKCVIALSKRQLIALLEEMLKRQTYYYNSAFWLDLGVSFPREQAKAIARRALGSV